MTHPPDAQRTVLTPDNLVVHGLWIGSRLSNLELLTLRSFLHHGHEFHLWVYDEIETPLPSAVKLRDATEIYPREAVFSQRANDIETGVGAGSVALFADLFRYKLLYEHGGYWVDMDVTCIRPFEFDTAYVFRTHRIGVVGNIMKCQARSELMRLTLDMASQHAGEDMEWLLSNRLLSANVERLNLTQYIRPHLCNRDDWLNVVRPLVETCPPIPAHWYAIHWVSEFWKTIERDGGFYKGRRVVETIPDRNVPPNGSYLEELYRRYGLIDVAEPAHHESSVSAVMARDLPPNENAASHIRTPLNTPATLQPPSLNVNSTRHVNILIPGMILGGAERTVQDLLVAYASQDVTVKLFLLFDAEPEYLLPSGEWLKIYRLSHLDSDSRFNRIALEVFASPTPVVYTHMVPARLLRRLWVLGVTTIPVIHNSRQSWQDPSTAFSHENVPFVVAVSESVADQLRSTGCDKPVIVIRHELQRWFSPDELDRNRNAIRRQYAISGDTILIGMVGQFKSQKAYPRAIRVLHEVRQFQKAKLMILGGWDHDYAQGRATYIATCRLALDLGVMPDVIMPGSIQAVEPYYAAFDVFLNTSVYEGLSIAMLEAIQCGCHIVTADAGGNREALPPTASLIDDSADIEAYVEAIWDSINRMDRHVPGKPRDSDLIPSLWRLLATHGVTIRSAATRDRDAGVLFVTDNLNLGGPQRSLTNLLTHLPAGYRSCLAVLSTVYSREYLETVQNSGIPVFSLEHAPNSQERAEALTHLLDTMAIGNVCFWNASAQVKLLLAKVLHERAIRLIDVSPGPMLFSDLDAETAFQQRIGLTAEQYFRRINCFVSKYTGGDPQFAPEVAPGKLSRVVTIPNGVPEPSTLGPMPTGIESIPDSCDANLAIGTCCRITPTKRIEYLIDMMAVLTGRLPGTTLTIVGGVDPRHVGYWHTVEAKLRQSGLRNVYFVGGHADVRPFLQRFKVFVMISDEQGCPNASLEAMSMGLPIVANPSGGTSEQVEDGLNGYLVSAQDPAEMSARVEELLNDPIRLQEFGAAGARIARERFSMKLMVERYMAVFAQPLA